MDRYKPKIEWMRKREKWILKSKKDQALIDAVSAGNSDFACIDKLWIV
jgi:hypothetical protein